MLLSLRSDQILEDMILKQEVIGSSGEIHFRSGSKLSTTDVARLRIVSKTRELLIEDPRLDEILPMTRDRIEKGVETCLSKEYDKYSTVLLLSNLRELIGSYFSKVVSQLLDLRNTDPITFQHSVNVCWYSLYLGLQVGLDSEDMDILLQASILHDLGKSFIPANILTKNGKLTEQEYSIVKFHSEYGEHLCKEYTNDRVARIIRQHHEYLDGTGYPDQLVDHQIDPLSKIITVVDIFDAVTCRRSYRDAMSHSEALSILNSQAVSGKIDSELTEIFSIMINKVREVGNSVKSI